MSKNHKYTNDGKKVVIIGQLNSKETIVQEIFISNGVEVPSGENFVVKSLHDAPAISWQEDKTKKIKSHFDETKIKYDYDLKMLHSKYKSESEALRELLFNIDSIKNNTDIVEINEMVMFLTGKITHIVKISYNKFEILEFIDVVSKEHELKIVTLFGGREKGFSWKLNQYGDGSGGYEYIYPCMDYESAKSLLEKKIIEKIESDRFDEAMILAKNKYSLNVPTIDQINDFYKKTIIRKREHLSSRKKEDDKITLEIEKLENNIK